MSGFATSLSAFGMKPGTTGSSTNVFGGAQAQPTNSSPFGAFSNAQNQNQGQTGTPNIFGQQGQQQQQQPTTGGFSTGGNIFGNTQNQTQNQPSGSIFGNTQQQQQNPQQGQTNIFGNLGGQQQQNQHSSTPSIFGNNAGQQNQTPSLFGNNVGAQQQNQTGTPSIFGNNNAGQQNQNPQTSTPSLFGNTNQNQPSGTGGVFGNANNQNEPQGNTSIFGNLGGQQQQQNQPQGASIFGNMQQQGQGGSIFGNTTNQQQNKPPSLFSGGIFGSQQQQQQPQSQGQGLWGNAGASTGGTTLFGQPSASAAQQQAPPPFTKTTKYNDLPEQAQKMFESIDSFIQGRIQISKNLKERSLDEEPKKAAEIIRKVHIDLANTLGVIQSDKAVIDEIGQKSDQSAQDTTIATRIMDGFKNPQQNGAYLKNHANFPLEFFNRASEEIRQKLQWYKATIEQVERRLVSAQTQVQYNPQAIVATLQAQNTSFVALAGKTAELDTQLQKLKVQYRELWRAHTGSARDPFNELDRRPGDGSGLLNGIGSLNLSR